MIRLHSVCTKIGAKRKRKEPPPTKEEGPKKKKPTVRVQFNDAIRKQVLLCTNSNRKSGAAKGASKSGR